MIVRKLFLVNNRIEPNHRPGTRLYGRTVKRWNSSSHGGAACRALEAFVDAFLHVSDTLAVVCALRADLSALAACMYVLLAANEHEMRGRPAYLGASHETEVSFEGTSHR